MSPRVLQVSQTRSSLPSPNRSRDNPFQDRATLIVHKMNLVDNDKAYEVGVLCVGLLACVTSHFSGVANHLLHEGLHRRNINALEHIEVDGYE